MANETLGFLEGNNTLNHTLNESFKINMVPLNLPFLDNVFYGNSIREYLSALILLIAIAFFMKLLSFTLIRILEKVDKKHPTQFREMIVGILKALRLPLFLIIALKVSSAYLELPILIDNILKYTMLIVITYYSIRAIISGAAHVSKRVIKRRETEYNDKDPTLVIFLTNVFNVLVWLAGLIYILNAFNVNLSKVFTGLGIAGIAVAFALQSILGDIFASISIYFDKPFKPGDYIMFDGYEGTVIKTGIKSTRIKLLRGEELIISNKLLTESRVQNIDRMQTRRIDLDLGVKYSTPRKTLEKLPKMLEMIVKKYKKELDFDRCFLKTFKEYSIEFELIYIMKTNDYRKYLEMAEKINLDILELFEREGIEFAYPTQTIHVDSSSKNASSDYKIQKPLL
jgi:small-conductance mechanosensitive channel